MLGFLAPEKTQRRGYPVEALNPKPLQKTERFQAMHDVTYLGRLGN